MRNIGDTLRLVGGDIREHGPAMGEIDLAIAYLFDNGHEGEVLFPAPTAGAKKAYIKYREYLKREMPNNIDLACKSADNAARLAGLFHLVERGANGMVSADTFERARKIAQWHLDECERVERVRVNRLSDWLAGQTRAGSTEITVGYIQNRGPSLTRRKADLDLALETLKREHHVRERQDGRSRFIRVNPKLVWSSGTHPA